MIRRRHSVTAVLLGTVLVAGCDGGGAANGGAAAGARAHGGLIDPCAVITREDAGKLMGTSFDAGKVEERKAVGLGLCIYHESGKGAAGALVQVGLTQQPAMPAGTKQTPETIFRSIRTEGFPDAPRLAGVGEDSFVAPPGVHILDRGVYLTVSTGLAPNRERLEKVAALAVANLERHLAGR
jgi:hypothetical protein